MTMICIESNQIKQPSHMMMAKNDLIVDFPSRSAAAKKRGVHFSETSSLAVIESSDASSKWYSSKDYREFKLGTKHAVHHAHKRLRAGDGDAAILTGIENLLSPEAIRKTKSIRAQYVQAILDEQERQDSSGVYDSDMFAAVAGQFTKGSARRARTLAMLSQSRR